MRYLLLSILVLFATQPLQASFCDMGMDPDSSHQATPGGDIQAGMEHSRMDHNSIDHGGDNQKMDCCDDEPASSGNGCATMAHCGACPAGLVAMNPVTSAFWPAISSGNMSALSQVPPNQFSSPPFRPPIS